MGLRSDFLTILVLLYFNKSSGFNLDLDFVDIVESGNNNDYFGYSVLLQKGSTPSLLVGAPKSNSSYPSHTNIVEPGVLYRCDIGTPNSCKQFVIDKDGNSELRDRHSYNRKDGSLLGATIDGGENVGEPFIVCSPRWINDRMDRNGQHYLANGMCYRLRDSRNLNEIGQKVMPLIPAEKQGYTKNDVVKYYYAIGEVGMSIQYLNKENILLLGAPGVLNWKGTVLRYQSDKYLRRQQRSVKFRGKRQTYSKVDVPNPVYISSIKEENSYFGYAVSSGRFDLRYLNLWYVAGAPRAEDLYGVVLLYEFSQDDDSDLKVHKKLIGDQMGAYFGAALLSTDVTRNGAADLLVGAPTYFTETFDEGCVYFYKNDGQGNFENPQKIFGSKKAGERFGTTISNLGDINQDSYQDVAIAAPYEDEQGAVYIYLGGKNGLNPDYSQKISAKAIGSSLRGFGFSISKGVDIDQNLYNDVAVGAYKSSQVTIIKSRPVIKYFATLSPNTKELSVDVKQFNVTYCINYKSATNNVNNVDTNIQIIKDSRAINNSNIAQTVTLTSGNSFCADTEIMLSGSSSDYTKAFSIEMRYSTVDHQPKEFCPTCPVINPSDSKSVMLNIPFANGCGPDNVCQPDLKISAQFENNLSSLIIGSITTLRVNVRIENTNEPAYLCQVHMKLPQDVEILRVSSKCELNDDRMYNCLVDNVLQPNTYTELAFDLDIKKLNPRGKELFLNLTVDSKGEEVNLHDNSASVVLPLRLENNIEIVGKSFPDQIVYVDEANKVKSEAVNVTHEFSIKNIGPSPLLPTTFHFSIPVELNEVLNKAAFDIFEPEIYINNQLMECTTDYPSGFFTNKPDENGGASDIDETQANAVLSRLRRESEVDFGHHSEHLTVSDMFLDLPVNRTVFVNCSSSDFTCMHITCKNEEIIYRNQYVTGKFAIRAHIDTLQQILNNKDIIVISSTARTEINGKEIQNHATTLLIGSLSKEEVSYWIYIVCVIAAFVILAILVFVLYKLNFFSRPVREKLQNEVENSSEKRELDDDDHDDED